MTRSPLVAIAVVVVLAAACGPQTTPPPKPAPVVPPKVAVAAQPLPPVEPPAPGTPGGLPDDRTPISEAPFTATSAQGAANVVQTYYALIGEKKYADAWALWSDEGRASGLTAQAFAASFDKYDSFGAQIGAPGRIEGAAGSLFVETPVVIYGRLKSGQPVHMNGQIRLRRVNDVPGSTEIQRSWRIAASELRPSPQT